MVGKIIRRFLFPDSVKIEEKKEAVEQALQDIASQTKDLKTKVRHLATHPNPINELAYKMRHLSKVGGKRV